MFLSTFQGKFNFQGLFKTFLYIVLSIMKEKRNYSCLYPIIRAISIFRSIKSKELMTEGLSQQVIT